MKESVNNKGDRLIEEGMTAQANGTNGMKGGILLERSTSKGRANSANREEASIPGDNLPTKTKSAASLRNPLLPL